MGQEVAGLSSMAAATMVGFLGLFNGLGRIGWASFSDKIGRANTYMIFFIIQIIAFYLLPEMNQPIVFIPILFVISTSPSLSIKNISNNFQEI
jgi:OFA family oxalate/formate antiporter-like MFS transporter